MRNFVIQVTIPETLLTTVIGLLAPEVSDLKVTEAEKDGKRTPKPTAGASLRRYIPKQEHRTHAAVRKALTESGPLTRVEVAKALEADGFAASSMSPTISGMMKEGKVRYREDKKLELTGA